MQWVSKAGRQSSCSNHSQITTNCLVWSKASDCVVWDPMFTYCFYDYSTALWARYCSMYMYMHCYSVCVCVCKYNPMSLYNSAESCSMYFVLYGKYFPLQIQTIVQKMLHSDHGVPIRSHKRRLISAIPSAFTGRVSAPARTHKGIFLTPLSTGKVINSLLCH